MLKRSLALLLAVLLLTLCAAPALAAAPKVKKTEYEGNGLVEVDFTTNDVRYKSAKVVVKGPDGKKLTASIVEKESDGLTFKVKGLKAGKKYSYTISGVRAGATGSYGKVKGSFKTPSDKPTIQTVNYDSRDKELEIEFATVVQFKNVKVTIKDASGKKLKISKLEKGQDDLEMMVAGMDKGKTYTVTVYGVRVKGVGNYTKASKKFVA